MNMASLNKGLRRRKVCWASSRPLTKSVHLRRQLGLVSIRLTLRVTWRTGPIRVIDDVGAGRSDRQGDLMAGRAEMTRSPGHVF